MRATSHHVAFANEAVRAGRGQAAADGSARPDHGPRPAAYLAGLLLGALLFNLLQLGQQLCRVVVIVVAVALRKEQGVSRDAANVEARRGAMRRRTSSDEEASSSSSSASSALG